ncbi:MAG: hypothetical protein QM831_20905 [Kofleriaceae bacterium]
MRWLLLALVACSSNSAPPPPLPPPPFQVRDPRLHELFETTAHVPFDALVFPKAHPFTLRGQPPRPSDPEEVPLNALFAYLGQLPREEANLAAETLAVGLVDPDRTRQWLAARCLEDVHPHDDGPLRAKILDALGTLVERDGDAEVRLTAATALGLATEHRGLGSDALVTRMLAVARANRGNNDRLALAAFRATFAVPMPETTVELATTLIKSGDHYYLGDAFAALHDAAPEEACRMIRDALASPDDIRENLAIEFVADRCDDLFELALDAAVDQSGASENLYLWDLLLEHRDITVAQRDRIVAGLAHWQHNHVKHLDDVVAMIKRHPALP